MKRIFALAVLLVAAVLLTACGGGGEKPSAKPAATASTSQTAAKAEANGLAGKRVLVAYFSRADENYKVGYIEKGNTRIVAEMIAEATGGELFEIKTVKPYPKEHDPTIEIAKQEKAANARPEIAGTMPDVQSYDVVFLGYPIWWGDLPMACYTFFDKTNFAGKTVAPFCTHEGSDVAGTDKYIAETTKANVLEALAIRGTVAQNSRDEAKTEVMAWLKKLGYAK